ncbi:hypothetical protein [Candidatus Poriferisocius sp.]|uniref:hypothetical protein n=1 Tax=Candidatus Poriferisocius sp. TaxID=3101276 RepID=UPI003B516414
MNDLCGVCGELWMDCEHLDLGDEGEAAAALTDDDMSASGLTITTTIRQMGVGAHRYWRGIVAYQNPDTGATTTFDATCEREYWAIAEWAVRTSRNLLHGWKPKRRIVQCLWCNQVRDGNETECRPPVPATHVWDERWIDA